MASPALLLLLFFLSCVAAFAAADDRSDSHDAHMKLEELGLPGGLLPDSVKEYYLIGDEGRFLVRLKSECHIRRAGRLVRYRTFITGVISKRAITDLRGVQVLLEEYGHRWVRVNAITADVESTMVVFEVSAVGVVEKLPFDDFREIPHCKHWPAAATEGLRHPDNDNVYDTLEKWNLPPGLLPDSVMSFHSAGGAGSFVVALWDTSCVVNRFGIVVQYEGTITGTIGDGKITGLKGVHALIEGKWDAIVEIYADRKANDVKFRDAKGFTANFAYLDLINIPHCFPDAAVAPLRLVTDTKE